MPHISMEYAIMVPILLVQIILIPTAAAWMMDAWTVRRRETALQDVASHMGSTIQQLYFSLNREEITPGVTIQTANVPLFIEYIPYTIAASDRKVENSTMIDLQLSLTGTSISAITYVTLGPNVLWEQSTFVSNSTNPGVRIEKFSNSTLSFSFV